MTKAKALRRVCIHGHFYQPPRENPWLEELEKEDSAAPYHDWNERINSECYRANTAARMVDENNLILTMRNNYKWLSFNFGPTLMRWIEKYDPFTYAAILDADKESCRRFDGHGNAIAQAYNHLIMPLANRRDKITQAHWGIQDFKWRFKRNPEGMWLGETAVDAETLEVLADAGIKFTILSPFQAAGWRFAEKESEWRDVLNGGIPTGRVYSYICKNGKKINLFFYDGSLSKGIAFDRLLEHSSKLVSRIGSSFEPGESEKNGPWLVNIATDGESYGHHFKFGDMALTAAFQELEADPAVEITNYSAFLAAFPAQAEVEIIENTAWSCAHGLGRWKSDCGCHIGGGPDWHQKWRAPLREAMDFLRDKLAAHYEREMARLCKDPWKARDDYIWVMLDPECGRSDFQAKHAGFAADDEKTHRFFELLEMQRSAMNMYTSCGWFFDDIGGLESIIILRHAARAIQLAERTGAASPEPVFIRMLEKAPSNLEEYGNGARVYLKKAKPEKIGKDRVVANYAIHSLARSSSSRYRIYCYDAIPQREVDLGPNPAPCLYGNVTIRDARTLGEETYTYAVIHFGGLDFRCSVKPGGDPEEYERILEALQQSVEEQNTVKMNRILDELFGSDIFSLHDVFRDFRASIALDISQKTMGIYTDFVSHLYEVYRPLMASLQQWGIKMPADLRAAVRRVLSDEAEETVRKILEHERRKAAEQQEWRETDFFYRAHMGKLRSILEDARSRNVSLQLAGVSRDLGKALIETLDALVRSLESRKAGELVRLLNVCRELSLKPELWRLQTLYFDLVCNVLEKRKSELESEKCKGFFEALDEFLGCRFVRFFDDARGLSG